jgi:hypothetical protein
MRNRLIVIGVVLLVLLVSVFLGPRIWVALKFNQVGNVLLCNDDFSIIYEMTEGGLVVWSFELPEYPREDRFWLPYPVRLPNGNTLISDSDAGPVYEVNRRGDVVWKCDSLYEDGDFAFRWGRETVAKQAINRNILAVDIGEERGKVMEIDRDFNIVWQWDYVDDDPSYIGHVADAHTLYNGNTAVLINKRIVVKGWEPAEQSYVEYKRHLEEVYQHGEYHEYLELDRNGNVVKDCSLQKPTFSPNDACLLSNGHVLASYEEYGVAEYDSVCEEIWSFRPPESISTTGTPTGKAPMGAWSALRSSNGNTVVDYPSRIYIVDSRGQVLRRIAAPTVKSILGVKYISDGTENEGDRIYAVIGIVDGQKIP